MVDIKFSQFFDRPAVIHRLNAAKRQVLSKAGAFVRTAARRSIRPRKKTAKAGSPPSSHTGLLRRLIFFGYDGDRETVVIGPKLFRKKDPTIPQLLEHGGTATHWRSGKSLTYDAFPYMRPAMEAESDKFHGLFANAVK